MRKVVSAVCDHCESLDSFDTEEEFYEAGWVTMTYRNAEDELEFTLCSTDCLNSYLHLTVFA